MTIDIPGSAAPNNLHFAADVRATIVESDLYNICERIKEIDPRLFIVVLDSRYNEGYSFSIMEHCEDGVDRLIWRVKELDQRVLHKAEYLRSIPFEQRFEEAEKLEAKMKAEGDAESFNELYENLGRPMLRQLEHDGFIDPRNYTSHRKVTKK